jgi:hypothetical protein
MLESVCRRYYELVKGKPVESTWASILEDMAEDSQFKAQAGVLNYFRQVRNRIAHPETTSTKLDAESSYKMSVRLAKELAAKLIVSSKQQK